MRVLLTSTAHPHYNETGQIVRDLRQAGIEVCLDRSKKRVQVPEGGWKVLKIQEVGR